MSRLCPLASEMARARPTPVRGHARRSSWLLSSCTSIGSDHLPRDQILTDAEMLEPALGLSAPQLVCRDFDDTEAVALLSHVCHVISPLFKCDGSNSRQLA